MFEGVRHAIEERTARRRNRPFLEACMACCALVAIADGEVSLSERGRVDQILEAIDKLRFFDVHEAVDLFNGYVDGIVQAEAKGRRHALEVVKEMRHEAGDAVLLVKVALAISRADGVFLESERAQCEAICDVLGLELEDFL
ncbi:tellurite resistance TerB family protein [Pacificispira sp.]|uniref:tellurite resistance TerB family protein n=1 Tax=Pacificispira sp. TaxID=2888761 RepID=UPI003B52E944